MKTARLLGTATAGAWIVALAWVACAKTPPTPCPPGRFAVDGAPLVGAAGAVVAVESGSVAIEDVCPPVAATIKGSERKTKVKGVWPPGICTGVEGPVRLKVKVVSTCSVMRGSLRARKARLRRRFEAPIVGSQSSTSTTVASTPTTSVTTTTFQGALAPDYIMFSGAETGDGSETAVTNGCLTVSTPVRSGVRACEIPLGFFTPLRPDQFAHPALYVRIYHRIDVITPPSSEAFAPVIVMDVALQGITAADVGVLPDGSIRYRLRDRLNGVDLGFGDPLPSGVWRRIELFTSVGASTGAAELRIDGVTTVQVSGQSFGATPLDAVYISNNANQYAGPNGGNWKATFDDMAVTLNQFPGEGRIVRRQGSVGAPTYDTWTLFGASSIQEAWSQSPGDPSSRAETPGAGDPLAQTMRVAPFDQGIDPIAPGNTIKACQTWLGVGLTGATSDRSYAIRRRVGGIDADTPLGGLTSENVLRSDGLTGGFWRATLPELNAAEIGAVKSGGTGGTGLRVIDAWLVCEYQ